ncbi:hypothetical protein Patl1_19942 [Pistacia atlantica]|uniref:Uncharacterized protein n=1 Tax=Pistacia atlantica TaxID=434234 RepID=A0ACC1BI88_9ROSI|nr:hypothetical protein Patl1_19942 [Pistacia atlantica]
MTSKAYGVRLTSGGLILWSVPLISNIIILSFKKTEYMFSWMVWMIDSIRSGVTCCSFAPFPTVEQTYAHVRREAIRQSVMITGSIDGVSGAVLATKGLRLGSSAHPPTMHNGKHKSRASSEGLKSLIVAIRDTLMALALNCMGILIGGMISRLRRVVTLALRMQALVKQPWLLPNLNSLSHHRWHWF